MLRINHFFPVLLCLFLLAACDEAGWDSDGNGGNGNESTYFGPADFWELALENEGDFTLTRKNAITDVQSQINVEGTYTKLDSGFTRFSATNSPSGVNSSFAALEIGNQSMLIAPVETSSRQILALANGGTCPTAAVNGNWIKFRFANAANPGNDNDRYFGSWRYNPNDTDGASFSFREDYNLTNMSESFGGSSRDSADCEDGLASDTTYSDYLSSTYAVINIDKDVAANNEYVFGVPITDVTSATEFNGQYVGFLYQGGDNTFSTVSASCTDGICQIYSVTDINVVNTSSQIFTLTLDQSPDQPQRGFITGQLQNLTSQIGNIACAVVIDVNTEDNDFLACVGQQPAATIADATNLFLLSTD